MSSPHGRATCRSATYLSRRGPIALYRGRSTAATSLSLSAGLCVNILCAVQICISRVFIDVDASIFPRPTASRPAPRVPCPLVAPLPPRPVQPHSTPPDQHPRVISRQHPCNYRPRRGGAAIPQDTELFAFPAPPAGSSFSPRPEATHILQGGGPNSSVVGDDRKSS